MVDVYLLANATVQLGGLVQTVHKVFMYILLK